MEFIWILFVLKMNFDLNKSEEEHKKMLDYFSKNHQKKNGTNMFHLKIIVKLL